MTGAARDARFNPATLRKKESMARAHPPDKSSITKGTRLLRPISSCGKYATHFTELTCATLFFFFFFPTSNVPKSRFHLIRIESRSDTPRLFNRFAETKAPILENFSGKKGSTLFFSMSLTCERMFFFRPIS